MGGQEALLTTGEIRSPSDRIIFLDEGYATYGGFAVYYDRASWWDHPPTRHNNGITLGYADGHSDFVKWRDKRTIELSQGISTELSQPSNEDLAMIQKGIFGTLGY
jgi:prepilin-type processing-associated H-X9-DG protein